MKNQPKQFKNKNRLMGERPLINTHSQVVFMLVYVRCRPSAGPER